MGVTVQQFLGVFLQTLVSLGGTLVYVALLWVVAQVVEELKLQLIFKRVTPLVKLLATVFLATLFLGTFTSIYSKTLALITSGNVALLVRLGKSAEGALLIWVLYKIYQRFQPPSPTSPTEETNA